ncbi:MAG: ATPase with chaperone activity [Rubrivivax sp.]
MHEDSQVVVPEAFIDLFRPPGADRSRRPLEAREVIAERHEFCEDLAQMLSETAREKLAALGVTEADVLERIRRGLLEPGSPVTAPEASWVIGRLAELLGWPSSNLPS